MIGVGITTRNRRAVALHTVEQWRKYLPEGAKLVVVDDASDEPFPGADHRFEENAGIAVAKNKCLQLLEDCEYIFLADDDIFPKSHAWHMCYTNSELEHACYIFGRMGEKKFRTAEKLPPFRSYDLPRGCLLFLTKKCLDTVGGFDTNFKLYGWEHCNFSLRVFNAGLIPYPYVDAYLSGPNVLHSLDEHKQIVSSVKPSQRGPLLYKNKKYFDSQVNSTAYIPYK